MNLENENSELLNFQEQAEIERLRKIERIKAEAAGRARADLEKRGRGKATGVTPSSPAQNAAVQPVRAINEDDDGYDPYSDLHDRRVEEPLFQRNPWE